MTLAGFVGHRAGAYEVELAPAPGNTSRWAYNASRPFELITELFVAPLDPKTRYTAWLRNTDANATLQFRAARYRFTNQDAADAFEAQSKQLPQEKKKRNVGAIVGGTVSCLVLFELTTDRGRRGRGACARCSVLLRPPPPRRGADVGRVSRRHDPADPSTHLDLTEEPQVMVPYSQVSPRSS